MLHEFIAWLQTELGKGGGEYPASWSESLLGSLNFWGLLEGTHLLSLMLFVGTIMLVDLRMLGVIFKTTPFTQISAKVLPLTVFGFILVVISGMLLFFADPIKNYHNIFFRVKMVLIILAMINLVVFHHRAERSQAVWDNDPKPPRSVRFSAAVSLVTWLLVIACGRYIAYNWFECGKPQPAFINAVQECASWPEKGAIKMGEL